MIPLFESIVIVLMDTYRVVCIFITIEIVECYGVDIFLLYKLRFSVIHTKVM